MASDLPSEFDVVVLGTGLPESILAAAFSRIGYKVLHVDRNDYYSSNWASFNIEGVEKWKSKNEKAETKESELSVPTQNDGEKVFHVPQCSKTFSNISTRYHIPDELEAVSTAADAEENQDKSTENENISASESEQLCEGQFDDKPEDDAEASSEEVKTETKEEKPSQKIWTATEIKDNWRRFNLDIVPKVMYCSGQMVDLLIVSDVAKYCEFRTVSQVLTLLNGQLEKVPCSRADVFGSKKVSMLEKRLLMKFLTFCAEYEKHTDQYQDFVGKSFKEFLTFRKLTPNIHHFVYHSIAMATETTTTEEGLKKTQHFLQSLGRYGNTAFLFPLYGSGEIPQGFCRLCAVFGGVYCLQMSATHIITDEENKCIAVQTTEGQRISCKHLVLGPSYIPEEFENTSTPKGTISRAVLITNKTVFPSENLELSMMHLLPEDDPSRPVTILELPPSSMVCPRDTFVVHLTRQGRGGDPESDLTPIINSLFNGSDQSDSSPFIMWSLFFSHTDQSDVCPADNIPSNVHLLRGAGTEIDMDDIVEHTRTIWEKICPEEDFLPKPPNPEDIIYVDDAETKVGEGNENAFEDASEEKSETEDAQREGTDSEEADKNKDEKKDEDLSKEKSGPEDAQREGMASWVAKADDKKDAGKTEDEKKEEGDISTEKVVKDPKSEKKEELNENVPENNKKTG